MRILLFGLGKMGQRVAALAQERGHTIVASIHDADVAIDFSIAHLVLEHIRAACKAEIPIVIGTTGWEADLPRAKELISQSNASALYAPNFSLGVALFKKLLKQAQNLLTDYAIAGVEFHHKEKKDAPSGTAKAIAEELEMRTPFSAVRCGSIIGKHEVLFDSPQDSLTFIHEAKSRDGFALGAIKAAEWIWKQKGWFTLDDMLLSADYTI